MYFYIGILTASLVVLTNAGNGLSIREKRQANANKLQAIVESGKTLTEIIKEIKGLMSDSLSAYIGDLDKEVRKIDTSFDGLKAEERRYVEEAHTLLTTSGTNLFLLRQTLTLLAKETIERSNRIIKVFKMVEDQPDKASKLIIYSQKKMNHLFVRSKSILKQSLDDYNDILKNVRNTKTKLESFIRHVDGLGDDDNERFKQWKKEIRAKVYGGSTACLVFPPSCALIYPGAAAILESKIKKRKEAVQRLINAASRAEMNAKNLKKKVDEKEKYVAREIDLVNKWSSQVAQNSEEYASSEDILFFLEIFGQKDAINMLCDLTKASKDYIDHKLPGLEEYEITAPPLDSACPGSGTTTTPDKPTAAWRQKNNADCWKNCGEKGGSCPNFCGHNAYCCRKGFGGCPAGAAEVSPNYHTCVHQTGVQQTAWRQKSNTDCWKNCGQKGGSCPNFCGHNAYCCRKGRGGCPAGAAEVSPNYHTCVQQTAWRQKNNADCWYKCGKKGGSCPNFCGNNAYCCRKGRGGCPAGAAEVSPNYHTCVQQTAWRQKNNADCWKSCGQKGGSCPNFCGHNAYCCRKGRGGCPAGAAEVSPNYHTCVQQTG